MFTPLTLGLISATLIAIGLALVLRDMWRARASKSAAATVALPSPTPAKLGDPATLQDTTLQDTAAHPIRADADRMPPAGMPPAGMAPGGIAPVDPSHDRTTARRVTAGPAAFDPLRAEQTMPRSSTTSEATARLPADQQAFEKRSTDRPTTARIKPGPVQDIDAAAAVTIVHKTAPPPPRTLRPNSDTTSRVTAIIPGESPAFDQLQSAIANISAEASTDEFSTEGQRWPNVEKRWLTIAHELDAAVIQLNHVLAAVDLEIGPAGESGWSFKNRGYGAFRRLLLNGRSISWLRIELTNTGQLSLKARSHAVEQALLNASAQVKADGGSLRGLLDGLSKTIRPAAEYAAWTKPRLQAEAEANQDGWSEVAAVATQALSIAAAAFREASADIVETVAPSFDVQFGRYRWPLAMKVGGNIIGRVHVDLVRRTLEVSVDEPDRLDLARRQAIDTLGITPHALAEVIANCAWPTVAEALQPTDANTALGYAG